MTTRWARLVRGQFVAVFATFVAAFSHGATGGGHPPLFAIALALAFSSIACVFLAGARLSRIRLAASVAISQLLYHGLFSLLGVGGTPTGGVTAHHHGAIVFSPASAAGTTAVESADQWMLLAHAGAAVATFAILLYGERLCLGLWSLASLAVSALAWLLPTFPAPDLRGHRIPSGHRPVVPHRLQILTSSLRHRGPPAALRFA